MSNLKIPVNAEDHVQGDKNARITLLEYGDYECPYCGLAYPSRFTEATLLIEINYRRHLSLW